MAGDGRAWRAAVAGLLLAAALATGPAGAAEPAAAPAAEAVYLHPTVPGDTVIGLARRLLVDPRRWPEIARANALRDPNRIPTGATLGIPLRLMRSESVPATVQTVQGQAQRDGTPLHAGDTVPEGEALETGDDGHATVRLVDGTLLRLRPSSRLQVERSRRLPDAGVVDSGSRLERGRVEVEATPAAAGRPGFRIDTPQGVLAVRGTEFRVAIDAADGSTRGEVLGGAVQVEGRDGAPPTRVQAGYGTVIASDGRVVPPVRLLGAPDLGAVPTLHQLSLLRIPLPALPGAAAWRGQIARDERFELVLADLTSATPELRFADLPDGDYRLRVRAVDTSGLEGEDAQLTLRLKARPEPPLPALPAPRAVVSGTRVELGWTGNAQATHYRLRLARESAGRFDIEQPLQDLKDLRQTSTVLDALAPGVYHWQLASVRGADDQGPWGVLRSFEMRPLPPTPPPPAVGDRTVRFSWPGSAGQRFDFQLARDDGFRQLLLERQLDEPGIELPLPGTGRFHMRMRVRDPDGFVGPYTAAQHFDVPNCLRDRDGGCIRAGGAPLTAAP